MARVHSAESTSPEEMSCFRNILLPKIKIPFFPLEVKKSSCATGMQEKTYKFSSTPGGQNFFSVKKGEVIIIPSF